MARENWRATADDPDEEVWTCPYCGEDCKADFVGSKCPSCGVDLDDEDDDDAVGRGWQRM